MNRNSPLHNHNIIRASSWLILLLMAVALPPLHAQEESTPVPLRLKVPDQVTWRMEMHKAGAAGGTASSSDDRGPAKSPPAMSVETSKSGTIYRVRYSKAVDRFKEVWLLDGKPVALKPPRIVLIATSRLPNINFRTIDLEEFAWVNQNNYISSDETFDIYQADNLTRPLTNYDQARVNNLVSANNMDIEMEIEQLELEVEGKAPAPTRKRKRYTAEDARRDLGLTGTITAYVDRKTGLPVRYESSAGSLSITYSKLNQKLAVPELVSREMKKRQELAKRLSKGP